MARTEPSAAATATSSPSASAVFPAVTASWTAATAAGVPRSSSRAAVNASASTGFPEAPPTPPAAPRLAGVRADPLARPPDEGLQSPVGDPGLLQRCLGELDHRAVVRGDQ